MPPNSDSLSDLRQIAQELTQRGNTLRDAGGNSLVEALATYQQAIETLLPFLTNSEDPGLRDELGSAWTNQGIAWMLRGSPVGLQSALACFESAAEVREPLLRLPDPRYRYHLAGVWLNHGDVLARLEDTAPHRARALASYDRALALMQELDCTANPLLCRRLMLAWLNRGSTLLRAGEPAQRTAALGAFAAAVAAQRFCPDDQLTAALAAAAWITTAEALHEGDSWDEARPAVERGLAMIRGQEKASAEAALIGLRGRLTYCLLAARYAAGPSAAPAKDARLAEAMEVAEDGLRLAAQWPAEVRFGPFILELFRLGAEAYAWLQPHFLLEFLQENFPLARMAAGDSDAKRIAAGALTLGLGRVAREAFPTLQQPGIERSLATFRQLREAAEQFR